VTMPLPSASVRCSVALPIDVGGAVVPTVLSSFDGLADGLEHVALVVGAPLDDVPLVRVHSECMTGDVFGSCRCDCGPQLGEALTELAVAGGILLYLRQEGRGIGLYNKIDTYALQQQGHDTFDANALLGFADDLRDYSVAVQMLGALGVGTVDLLSNNPDKAAQLRAGGITVRTEIPTATHVRSSNEAYLVAKARRSGHRLTVPVAVAHA